MTDHMNCSLAELKDAVVADGVIDASEAAKIRERLFADGRIDKAEAEFVFDVNDAVSGQANDAAWQSLFVDAICDFLLNDEQSPGVVDGEEAAWLLERIQRDDQLDDTERALLKALKSKATSVADGLLSYMASA